MMDVRLGYLLIGCAIGFVLGYVVRSIRELKDKVEEVDKHVLGEDAPENPPEGSLNNSYRRGFWRNDIATGVALFLVVALTAYAAFLSQKSSNAVERTQDRQEQTIKCTQQYLAVTINALNVRTTSSAEQAKANVELQKAFNVVVLASLHVPPYTKAQARVIVQHYADALQKFLTTSSTQSSNTTKFPYPTPTDLIKCINKK